MNGAMRAVSWLKGVSFAVCGLAGPAGAAEVDWNGPATCPDAAELRFSIERTIGMPLSHALPLHFEVRAERSAEGYVARIDVAGSPQEAPRRRVLVASDCSRLAELVAVTAAIALGGNDGAADTETSPGLGRADIASSDVADAPLRSEGAPVAVDRQGVGERSGPTEPAAAWSPALSVWVLADAGSLQRLGTGVALGAGVEHGRLALRALATWLFEQRAGLDAAAAPGTGADLTLATGALSVCSAPLSRGSRWSVQGCAGWELGRLSGEGTGILRPRSGAAFWSAPRLDATLGWALGSNLELGAMLTLAIPLVRDDFVLGGLGSVHRPAPVVGRAALGINWTIE